MASSGKISGWTEIQTLNGDGVSGIIEFTNIPQIYDDLQLRIVGRGDNASTSVAVRLTVEASPTSGAYNRQHVFIAGTTVTGAELIGVSDFVQVFSIPGASSPANCYGSITADILQYRNTNMFKNVLADAVSPTDIASGGLYIARIGGVIELTAAIDRIRLTLAAGNWTTQSIVKLLGRT